MEHQAEIIVQIYNLIKLSVERNLTFSLNFIEEIVQYY